MSWKNLIVRSTLIVALAALCGCDPAVVLPSFAGSWEYKEVKRIKSPESELEAVLLTGDAGATTANTTFLFLVPAGSRLDPKKEAEDNLNKSVFTADHLSDLTVVWRNPRLVEIGYKEARIHHFQNVWSHRDIDRYAVELRLAPPTNEFALPWRDRYR
jgi:hypothetical protein